MTILFARGRQRICAYCRRTGPAGFYDQKSFCSAIQTSKCMHIEKRRSKFVRVGGVMRVEIVTLNSENDRSLPFKELFLVITLFWLLFLANKLT